MTPELSDALAAAQARDAILVDALRRVGWHDTAKEVTAARSRIKRVIDKRENAEQAAAASQVVSQSSSAAVLTVELPIRTFSEANRRGHWSKGHKQVGDQRRVIEMAMRAHANARGLKVTFPCTVKITRLAPDKLDPGDGLPMSQKHTRDGVADWLGINDRDDATVHYEYAQLPSKHYGVRIEVRIGGRT